jgi:hypothetical protein
MSDMVTLLSGGVPRLLPFTGTVTPELTAWAQGVLHSEAPLGTLVICGDLAARVEEHTWTWRDGQLVHGHFRGVTLYHVANAAGTT